MNKILKFSASWCQPCKHLAKTIETLDQDQQSQFTSYDIDECDRNLLAQYNIRGIPSLVVLDEHGNVKKQTSGALSKQTLIELLDA